MRWVAAAAVFVVASAWTVVEPAGADEPPERQEEATSSEPPAPNTVTAYGAASDHGPAESMSLAAPLVGMAATRDGAGYWLTGGDGGVFTFGDAVFHGSTGAIDLASPVVGMAAHPSGDGYWLVSSDGGVFSFGASRFYGSMGAQPLNQPVVGMAAHPSGDGYWLVAADGGVFSFGEAVFHGSTGATDLASPVVGMAAHPSGDGYWLVSSDGGVFSFGSAEFFGSEGGNDIPHPVIGIAVPPDGNGYWLAARNGQVHPHGVTDHGNAAENELERKAQTVGIAAQGQDGYWLVHGAAPVSEIEDTGPRVEAIQRRLDAIGYWLGPIDGVFGDLTEQAVYAFQKYEGLQVDGDVDTITAARLDDAAPPVARTTSGDVIEVDKARQLLFVVRGGETVWVFNTSTGTEEPYTYEGQRYMADTPPGRWDIYRQVDGYRTSNLGRLYRPKYFHTDGIAVHGYSFVPPYPASHGCVRVTNAGIDFIWVNELAPIGTEVWVYGESPDV